MSELRELTSIDLRARIRDNSGTSKPEDSAAWELLNTMIEEQCLSMKSDRLTAGRRWLLETVEVTGFRGVKDTSTLHIDASRRLTVIYGENGTGKSSITEALRLALEGQSAARHISDGSRTAGLWVPISDLNALASEGTVKVALRDDTTGDQLLITAQLASDGEVTRSAVLTGGENEAVIDAAHSDWEGWKAATRASLPVVAYADLADELQKQKHLGDWLTSCLAMGSHTTAFDALVSQRERTARGPETAIAAALGRSRELVEAIDDATPSDVRGDAPAIDWVAPTSLDTLHAWQVERELLPVVAAEERIEAEQVAGLLSQLTATHEAGVRWLEAANELAFDADTADALTKLAESVAEETPHADDAPCPVCGSVDAGWQKHLKAAAKRLAELGIRRETLQRALVRCEELIVAPLLAARSVHDHGEIAYADVKFPTTELAELSRRQRDGMQAEKSVTETISALVEWARTPKAQSFLANAVELSGSRSDWRRQRWDATTEFVDVFKENIADASTSTLAKRAKTLWDTTLRAIRKGRTAELEDLVGGAVADLLEDAGITIKELQVAKGKAELRLLDRNKNDLNLAHLSAGQRNALILAPVLATTRTGMFGFALIDDPVHAFDEFRVDKLAARLNRISQDTALLLTTHDRRFVEYLRAHSGGDFSELRAQRSDTGTVKLTACSDSSTELLDFCEALLDPLSGSKAADTDAESESNTPRPSLIADGTPGLADVAALMRLSVDEGLESVLRRHLARLPVQERAKHRTRFDAADATKDRQKELKELLNRPEDSVQRSLLESAWSRLAQHVRIFNPGAHPGESEFEVSQLRKSLAVTRDGVAVLAEIRW